MLIQSCVIRGAFFLINNAHVQDLAKFPVDADDLELSFVVVKSMSKDNEISHYQVAPR